MYILIRGRMRGWDQSGAAERESSDLCSESAGNLQTDYLISRSFFGGGGGVIGTQSQVNIDHQGPPPPPEGARILSGSSLSLKWYKFMSSSEAFYFQRGHRHLLQG